jgi:hypothetical protein
MGSQRPLRAGLSALKRRQQRTAPGAPVCDTNACQLFFDVADGLISVAGETRRLHQPYDLFDNVVGQSVII